MQSARAIKAPLDCRAELVSAAKGGAESCNDDHQPKNGFSQGITFPGPGRPRFRSSLGCIAIERCEAGADLFVDRPLAEA